MDLSFTPEQSALRSEVRSHLSHTHDLQSRLALARSGPAWQRDWWSTLVGDLPILGIALPKADGGQGGGPVEHMIVMEEFGRALVADPYVETIVIGAELLARVEGARAADLLRSILAGDATLAFAWAEPGFRYNPANIRVAARRDATGWRIDGAKSAVTSAPWATHLLVAARSSGEAGDREGLSLFVVEAGTSGLVSHAYPTIDDRWAADLDFSDVRLPADALLGQEGGGLPLVEELIDRAIAAACAEAVGIMRWLTDDTMRHLQQRRQFGKPLAEQQVLQHTLVDMATRTELAASAAYLATLRLGAGPLQRARAAAAAKVTVGHGGRFVGERAVQLHGAIGTTDDHHVGRYFKRMLAIEGEFGTPDDYVEKYAVLSSMIEAESECRSSGLSQEGAGHEL